jgi:hypothetical protein
MLSLQPEKENTGVFIEEREVKKLHLTLYVRQSGFDLYYLFSH